MINKKFDKAFRIWDSDDSTLEQKDDAFYVMTFMWNKGLIEPEEYQEDYFKLFPAMDGNDHETEFPLEEYFGQTFEEMEIEAGKENPYKPGDIVSLDYTFGYKEKDMDRLVRDKHPFIILDKENTKILIYPLTSKLYRKELYPDYYTEIQSGRIRGLVELNAYGWVSYKAVYKVIAHASDEDLEKIKLDIETKHPERSTTCENLPLFRMQLREEMLPEFNNINEAFNYFVKTTYDEHYNEKLDYENF